MKKPTPAREKKRMEASQLSALGISDKESQRLVEVVHRIWSQGDPVSQWQAMQTNVLTPSLPFAVHQFLFEKTYRDWDARVGGPPPAWIPDPAAIKKTHLDQLRQEVGVSDYSGLFQWSIKNRETYWKKATTKLGIQFKKPFERFLDLTQGVESPRWFCGAELNIVDSCFQADPDATAVVYQKENGPLETLSYQVLHQRVGQVVNGLKKAGLVSGDAVAIDMAMTIESVIIYLGLVAAGCVAVSIADSFAPEEIKNRLLLTSAKAIFTQDHVERLGKQLPLYAKVIEAHAPRAIVVPWQDALSVSLRPGDLEWKDFLSANTQFVSTTRTPEAPCNFLFSSGTTGEPKVIPWSHTTPIKAAADAYFHHDIHPGDRVCWPTNLGWMMGPWVIFASLINQATLALYYGAPTGRDFAVFIQRAKVQMLGLVPSLVKAWRQSDCLRGVDWSAIRAFSSTGECSNASDYLFLMAAAGYKPVIEYCGGTEIGGAFLTGTLVQPASPATFSTPALGLEVEILDEQGKPAEQGEVFLVPPSIGLSLTLLNRDHYKVYFEGTPKTSEGVPLRRHGDQVERLPHGYFQAQGRADDTMNLGGIKVSSAEIERVLNHVAGVHETAAIAVNPPGGGPSFLVVFVVLTVPQPSDKEGLKKLLQKRLREQLNPLFKIEDIVMIASLPRTASNKVMRRALRAQYQPPV